MHNFPRPTDEQLFVTREAVKGACPECRSTNLASYPVLSEGGWWQVVKCQDCLASIRRDEAPMLGSFVPLSSTL